MFPSSKTTAIIFAVMSPESPVSLLLSVSPGDDASSDELDLAARELRAELAESGIADAKLDDGHALPPGAKGSTGSILGDVVVAVMPTLLSRLFDLLRDWKGRSPTRSIKLKAMIDGKRVEIAVEGADAETVAMNLLERLQRPGAGRAKPA